MGAERFSTFFPPELRRPKGYQSFTDFLNAFVDFQFRHPSDQTIKATPALLPFDGNSTYGYNFVLNMNPSEQPPHTRPIQYSDRVLQVQASDFSPITSRELSRIFEEEFEAAFLQGLTTTNSSRFFNLRILVRENGLFKPLNKLTHPLFTREDFHPPTVDDFLTYEFEQEVKRLEEILQNTVIREGRIELNNHSPLIAEARDGRIQHNSPKPHGVLNEAT